MNLEKVKTNQQKKIYIFINNCIKDNILSEFLEEHMDEVMSIETMLFEQDYVTNIYEHKLFKNGRKEGIEQGTINLLNNLVKQGLLTKEEEKKQLSKI